MDNSFIAYLERLELLAFFSGYPLIYALTIFIAGNQALKNNFKQRIVSLLPFSYALVGTLYLGLQLKKIYPDYIIKNIELTIQQPWLVTWALFSIVFWIPALGRKTVVSLFHSLVFFFLLVRDLFITSSGSNADNNYVRNDMNIYTVSLILNIGALGLIMLFSFLFTNSKKCLKS